jgi:CrcB protein
VTALRDIVAVFLGGGIGSVARYLLGMLVLQRLGPGVPYGTLLINVLGSFAIGVVAALAQSRAYGLAPSARLFLAVGLLGGFTTFSTFAYESITLAGEGAIGIGAAYVVASVMLGLAAAFAGMVVIRALG